MHSILRQMDGIKSYSISPTFLHIGLKVIVGEGMLAFLHNQAYYWVSLKAFQWLIKYHDVYIGNLCKTDSTT